MESQKIRKIKFMMQKKDKFSETILKEERIENQEMFWSFYLKNVSKDDCLSSLKDKIMEFIPE